MSDSRRQMGHRGTGMLVSIRVPETGRSQHFCPSGREQKGDR